MPYELFRTSYFHNSTQYSHIVKLTLHFLCSYRGGSLSHKTTFVQAHRGFRLLTLASTYYNITLFLSVNIGKKLLVSRQISDDIKQFSYEICQRHSVIIRYMETEHVELAHINQKYRNRFRY